jgi:nucleoside-diphosphate-sugar epimerase
MYTIESECLKIIEKINFEPLVNKKILITGASGLIGSWMTICLQLLKNTHNLELYIWTKNKLLNFNSPTTELNIITRDICDEKSFTDLPNFDIIIHAAGYGQPSKFLENKIKTIILNTKSTINLIQKLNKNGKFLFVSTSEIYSGNYKEEITENDFGFTLTNHPRSSYIEGKRCGESICYSYIEQNVDIKIIRLSLAYGPGTKKGDTRVLNSLIEKALKENEINLLDSGKAIRTYCYISDVIEMFWNIFLYGKEKIYNVGGSEKISIYELAKEIGNYLNVNVNLPKQDKSLEGSPNLVNMSINRYLQEFGNKNFIPLQQGLKQTINWQKKIYEENNL